MRVSGFSSRLSVLSLLGVASVAATLALLPQTAHAQVVYDNGSFVGAATARNISDFAIADDFAVASSLTFNAIRFYALDATGNFLTDFSGTVSWFLYQGSAGSPSPNAIPSTNIIASGSTAPTVTNTGSLVAGFQVGQLDFSIPTQNLGAGTYWLRLKEGAPGDAFDVTPIYWVETGAAITGNGFRSDVDEVNPTTWNVDGTGTTRDLSFQLINSAPVSAPEPGTLVLLALGMAGGIVARSYQASARRKK